MTDWGCKDVSVLLMAVALGLDANRVPPCSSLFAQLSLVDVSVIRRKPEQNSRSTVVREREAELMRRQNPNDGGATALDNDLPPASRAAAAASEWSRMVHQGPDKGNIPTSSYTHLRDRDSNNWPRDVRLCLEGCAACKGALGNR